MPSGRPRRLARTYITALVSAEPVRVPSLPDGLTTSMEQKTIQLNPIGRYRTASSKARLASPPNQTKEANQHNHLLHGKSKGVPPLSSGRLPESPSPNQQTQTSAFLLKPLGPLTKSPPTDLLRPGTILTSSVTWSPRQTPSPL